MYYVKAKELNRILFYFDNIQFRILVKKDIYYKIIFIICYKENYRSEYIDHNQESNKLKIRERKDVKWIRLTLTIILSPFAYWWTLFKNQVKIIITYKIKNNFFAVKFNWDIYT